IEDPGLLLRMNSQNRPSGIAIRRSAGIIIALTFAIMLVVGSFVPKSALAAGGVFKGTIYYTQFTGSVSKVSFSYDESTKTVTYGSPVLLHGSLPGGADGLVFDPQNGNLLIGSNNGANYVQEIDPLNPGTVTQITSGTSTPFHMMVDPLGTTAWTSG